VIHISSRVCFEIESVFKVLLIFPFSRKFFYILTEFFLFCYAIEQPK
jgi:hypothetical protein